MKIKQYTITKVVWAYNLTSAVISEEQGEIVQVQLSEEIQKPVDSFIGFANYHEGEKNREGNDVVPEVRQGSKKVVKKHKIRKNKKRVL